MYVLGERSTRKSPSVSGSPSESAKNGFHVSGMRSHEREQVVRAEHVDGRAPELGMAPGERQRHVAAVRAADDARARDVDALVVRQHLLSSRGRGRAGPGRPSRGRRASCTRGRSRSSRGRSGRRRRSPRASGSGSAASRTRRSRAAPGPAGRRGCSRRAAAAPRSRALATAGRGGRRRAGRRATRTRRPRRPRAAPARGRAHARASCGRCVCASIT